MSLLIVYRTKTDAWAIYDSFIGGEDEMYLSSTPKAYKDSGGGIIGAVGYVRAINIASDFSVGSPSPREVQASLVAWKAEEEDDEEGADESEIVLVWPGRQIVSVSRSGYWSPMEDWYAAGSASDMARGYLAALPPTSPKDFVTCAKAITKISPHVKEPIHTLHVSLTPKTTKKRAVKKVETSVTQVD
jgi:hypothetical protein